MTAVTAGCLCWPYLHHKLLRLQKVSAQGWAWTQANRGDQAGELVAVGESAAEDAVLVGAAD